MKKLLSVLLCAVMLFAVAAMPASAQEKTLDILVATDLHYDMAAVNAKKVPKRNSISEDYAHAATSAQLPDESYAIIVAFLEKAAAASTDYILLPGDFSNDGTKQENLFIASILKDFEAETGKNVYVVPGNHDLFDTSLAEFKEIYADFGYSEAVAKDSASGSYVVDLDGGFRLLAIDSTVPGESYHGVNAARAEWIKAQAVKAKAEGKKVFAMMHHNLVEHFIFGNVIRDSGVVNDDYPLGDILAENDVRFIFTGHSHEQDIAAYTADSGKTVYDIVTGALNVYPCPYRLVIIGATVDIETKLVDSIDKTLVPDGISENALADMESDFTQYTKNCAEAGLRQIMVSYTKPASLINLLKLDKKEDAEMCGIINKVGAKLSESLQMPFYKSQETTEGLSVESMVEKYEITLPSSDYVDMIDLAAEVYLAHVAGDENYPAYKNEIVLFSRGLSAVLSYALGEVTAEEYAQVLTFICKLLGADVPADIIRYAGDGISRFKGVEIIVTTIMVPVVTEFTVDEAPADNNVKLSGYADGTAETVPEEKSFWQKIEDFFIKIFEAIMSIFAFVG